MVTLAHCKKFLNLYDSHWAIKTATIDKTIRIAFLSLDSCSMYTARKETEMSIII